MRPVEICPKCGKVEKMTRHHVFPKRWFGNGKENRRIKVLLCRPCHNNLEKLIPFERMPDRFYVEILATFLNMKYATCENCGQLLLDQEEDGEPKFCSFTCFAEHTTGGQRITMDEQIVDDPPLAEFCHQ